MIAGPDMQRWLFLAVGRGEAKLLQSSAEWRGKRTGRLIEGNARLHLGVVR